MANWVSPITFRGIDVIAYNIEDLNRVEENNQYLSDRLDNIGYISNITTDYTWNMEKFFNESNDTRYMDNLHTLKNLVSITNALPDTLKNITKTTANTIEEIQLEINNRINLIENNRLFAKITAGTNRTRQFIQRG